MTNMIIKCKKIEIVNDIKKYQQELVEYKSKIIEVEKKIRDLFVKKAQLNEKYDNLFG